MGATDLIAPEFPANILVQVTSLGMELDNKQWRITDPANILLQVTSLGMELDNKQWRITDPADILLQVTSLGMELDNKQWRITDPANTYECSFKFLITISKACQLFRSN